MEIGIGIVGGGYMGKAHAAAMASVGALFGTELRPKLVSVAGSSPESSERYRAAYGFQKAAADWQALVADPEVEAVVIASPQATHRAVAEAAFAAGKPVFCEKPLGASIEDARAMVAAAEASGQVNMIGFNYIRTPASQFARQLIADGRLGQITWFRGEHMEDFHNDPGEGPATAWRYQGEANGCLGDLAPHVINQALGLMGPIEELNAVMETVYPERNGIPVTNDDQVQMMVRFASGVGGHITACRTATGRKMGYAYEIFGTQGAIRFDQEDQNAIWFYDETENHAERGFKKILTGPAHPDFKAFCLGPGHGTGYQDQIIIEAKDFLEAIAAKENRWPTFSDGLEVSRVTAAARISHAERRWTKISEIDGGTP